MPRQGKPKLTSTVGWSQFKHTSGVVRRQADFNAAHGIRFGSTPTQAYPDQVPGAAVLSSRSSRLRRRHFFQKTFHGQNGGSRSPKRKPSPGWTVLISRLPFDQNDLDALPGQAVPLEEWAQIALTLLPPIMHDDPPRRGLD